MSCITRTEPRSGLAAPVRAPHRSITAWPHYTPKTPWFVARVGDDGYAYGAFWFCSEGDARNYADRCAGLTLVSEAKNRQ